MFAHNLVNAVCMEVGCSVDEFRTICYGAVSTFTPLEPSNRRAFLGAIAMRTIWAAILAVGILLAVRPSVGQELRIGLATEPTSVDPLFHTFNPNNQLARHIFDRLVHQDTQQRLTPGL